MGPFQLGKIPLGKSEYSSGHRIPLGKLNPSLFAIWVNSPTSGVVLHNWAYGDGKSVLYSGVDPCNFTFTYAVVKDLQFYVRNPNSTQEQSPTVIFDESNTFTRATSVSGGGSVDQDSIFVDLDGALHAVGSYSQTTTVRTGTWGYAGMTRDFGTEQNWSGFDVLGLWIFGLNDGRTIRIGIRDTSMNNNYYRNFADNWSGWRHFTWLLDGGTATGWTVQGDAWSIAKSKVRYLQVLINTATKLNIDRVVVDTCPLVPVKKASMEFYLDNVAEETANPVVVMDDNPTAQGWWVNSWGTGGLSGSSSDDATTKIKGSNCLRFVSAAGTKATIRAQVGFGTDQNYSGKDFLSLYWYGANTGAR